MMEEIVIEKGTKVKVKCPCENMIETFKHSIMNCPYCEDGIIESQLTEEIVIEFEVDESEILEEIEPPINEGYY